MNKIFELNNASVVRAGKPILHELSLSIARAEHTAIIGPNGAGKTMLMKLLTGDTFALYSDNDPPVRLFGQSRYSIWEIKKRIGIITNDIDEKHKLYASHMPGIEIVLTGLFDSIGYLPQDELKRGMIDKADALMRNLGIISLRDHVFGDMSSGEARQCLIARALVSEPEVLMLDEPTTGLDIAAQLQFFDLIARICIGHTVIIITHHIEEVLPSIDNVVMIRDGRIFTQGPKKEVLTSRNISELFGVQLEVYIDTNGTYHFVRGGKQAQG
ncbi:MAG: ATP-binding cassette domain-containing protein [Nitrospirae bacterium]|nr:ATP-binding cassette domain-containing protein [Nitrospirota bacterium]